jgi:hypothetical protein
LFLVFHDWLLSLPKRIKLKSFKFKYILHCYEKSYQSLSKLIKVYQSLSKNMLNNNKSRSPSNKDGIDVMSLIEEEEDGSGLSSQSQYEEDDYEDDMMMDNTTFSPRQLQRKSNSRQSPSPNKKRSHDNKENNNNNNNVLSSMWLIPIPIVMGLSFVIAFFLAYFLFRRRIQRLEQEVGELRCLASQQRLTTQTPSSPVVLSPSPSSQPTPFGSCGLNPSMTPPSMTPPSTTFYSQGNTNTYTPPFRVPFPPTTPMGDLNSVKSGTPTSLSSSSVPVMIPVTTREEKVVVDEVKILTETEMDSVLEKELAELYSPPSTTPTSTKEEVLTAEG